MTIRRTPEAHVAAYCGRRERRRDLRQRRVIPGLIDGHIHAVRAGACWDRELHWTGMPDVAAALDSIRAAAGSCQPGEWIRAVGGWHPSQFTEGRSPTRGELDDACPDHPVYLQALYQHAVLNSAAQLTIRLRLFLSAVDPGREYEQLDGWLRHGQTRFGDGMPRFR